MFTCIAETAGHGFEMAVKKDFTFWNVVGKQKFSKDYLLKNFDMDHFHQRLSSRDVAKRLTVSQKSSDST